jgi:hypothetical protein
MKPVKKQVVNDMLDYHEMVRYVEEKYDIKVRDYLKRFDTNRKQIEEYNETVPKEKKVTGNTQYTTQVYKDFVKWRNEKGYPDHETIKYLDYWHWLLDNCFCDIDNGSSAYWNMGEILNDDDSPKWVREITQLFFDEFKDDLDKDGGLEVWISW